MTVLRYLLLVLPRMPGEVGKGEGGRRNGDFRRIILGLKSCQCYHFWCEISKFTSSAYISMGYVCKVNQI